MTKDEALKLALEALENWFRFDFENFGEVDYKAVAAIKEALAQPEQEPIGQLCEESYGRGQVMWFNKPVDGSYVYTTPPQRTWVGLTDEEIGEIGRKHEKFDKNGNEWFDRWTFARAIEAAHNIKEKNT